MPVQKLNRAIMYRAYPTPEQQVLLSKTFGCVRFVWNHMLMDAQRFLEEAGAFFIPTPAKYKTEFSFLKEVDSLALANAQLDLKNANKLAKMCDTTTIKDKEGELMKPIKLKELIATAKDPATQQIAIAENYTLYVVPLFEGLVKDVDKALAERILSDWRVETDSTRFIALVI